MDKKQPACLKKIRRILKKTIVQDIEEGLISLRHELKGYKKRFLKNLKF